ncbi:MAG: PKD domain-containing protein, partial [Sulfurovum sp.]|nr:PKD domain-containing protein [Sulfurovum sp.]
MKYTSFKTLALILSASALLVLSGCGSSGTPSDTELARVNLPPVANAGPDQNVSINDTVTLDGNASSDPDLDTLTYSWSLISEPVGSNAILSDATAVNPTFVADRNGSYILELIVNDGTVDSDADTVTITAIVISPLKTGQTTSYAANDDGFYQKGISPNFSRDNSTEI